MKQINKCLPDEVDGTCHERKKAERSEGEEDAGENMDARRNGVRLRRKFSFFLSFCCLFVEQIVDERDGAARLSTDKISTTDESTDCVSTECTKCC